jgi:hypothetical protein
MVTDSTEEGLTLSFIAICDWARLQSRRVRAVKFSFGIFGAHCRIQRGNEGGRAGGREGGREAGREGGR